MKVRWSRPGNFKGEWEVRRGQNLKVEAAPRFAGPGSGLARGAVGRAPGRCWRAWPAWGTLARAAALAGASSAAACLQCRLAGTRRSQMAPSVQRRASQPSALPQTCSQRFRPRYRGGNPRPLGAVPGGHAPDGAAGKPGATAPPPPPPAGGKLKPGTIGSSPVAAGAPFAPVTTSVAFLDDVCSAAFRG